MDFETEDGLSRLKERFARQAQDHDDLQHEIAGREVGRIGRFLPEKAKFGGASDKKRTERTEALTRLQILMINNPAYSALWHETVDVVTKAEIAAETALEKAQTRLEEADEAVEAMLDRAARLEDGRSVFRDAQGRVWTEDGELVSGSDADAIDWPPGAPGYEEFKAQKDAAQRARQDIDDIRRYQVDVLGTARDRMSDPENPPSEDELNQIKNGIDSTMPDPVRRERDGIEREGPRPADPTTAKVPDLSL